MGCGVGVTASAESPANTGYWRGQALGAHAELRVLNQIPSRTQKLIRRARDEIARLDNIFNLYRPESALSQLNTNGVLPNPPPELLVLLSIVGRMWRVTDGRFDPTMQPLWALYAQHRGHPSSESVSAAQKLVGWQHVRFDNTEVCLLKRGAQLSLNGIAQGFITDRIAQGFIDSGVTDALVDVGELRLLGQNERGEAWRVGIGETTDSSAELYVHLVDRAIATSSTYGTTFDGEVGHILDPRNGNPARPLWRRVSVIHASATIADAIATSAILMTEHELRRLTDTLDDVRLLAQPIVGDPLYLPSEALVLGNA